MNQETAKLLSELAPVGTLFVSAMSAIAGAVWIVITYIRTQRDLAATKLFEARKPFNELQLKLYTETSQVAAKLVSSAYGDEKWNQAIFRFWELYWSELSMVENAWVEKAMVDVGAVVGKIAVSGDKHAHRDELENAIYELAHALRDGLSPEWTQAVK
ncbi:hypothetical protein JQ604_17095 [Bradyrhizobium jicamae]|uniref:hypothetical protein n=1 Tax=Bradyrhizobium jicamae TaxID=280332 RepID=UPI001BA46934|nr:hypothetical protein [Bradyrhizobium jicamae]MBR0753903.1 hypothetical protein [Bradyrhizobium jicamae]